MDGAYQFHPVCRMFPSMTDEELDALIEDVRANGLRDPIVRWRGEIIEGRHRLQACIAAGVAPRFVEWDGAGSLVAFVFSKNFHRRHLNDSQKAVLGRRLAEELEREAAEAAREPEPQPEPETSARRAEVSEAPKKRGPKQTRRFAEAAAAVGVSERSIERAAAVERRAPELIPRVEAGDMSLRAAEEQISAPSGPSLESFCTRLESWRDDLLRSPAGAAVDAAKLGPAVARLLKIVRTGSAKGPAVTVADCTFPAALDTDECRKALADWLAYKRVRGGSYKSAVNVDRLLKRWAATGPRVFVDAVELSIANNYQGLVERRNGREQQQRHGAGQRYQAGADGNGGCGRF